MTGMDILLHVGEQENIPLVPKNFPKCGGYTSPIGYNAYPLSEIRKDADRNIRKSAHFIKFERSTRINASLPQTYGTYRSAKQLNINLHANNKHTNKP